MPVRRTSLDAIDALRQQGITGEQAQTLYRAVRNHPGITRRELVDVTGIQVNAVSGRCRELLDAGAIMEGPARPDAVTKRQAHPLYVRAGAKQGELWEAA